jgi:hypothetical protein
MTGSSGRLIHLEEQYTSNELQLWLSCTKLWKVAVYLFRVLVVSINKQMSACWQLTFEIWSSVVNIKRLSTLSRWLKHWWKNVGSFTLATHSPSSQENEWGTRQVRSSHRNVGIVIHSNLGGWPLGCLFTSLSSVASRQSILVSPSRTNITENNRRWIVWFLLCDSL